MTVTQPKPARFTHEDIVERYKRYEPEDERRWYVAKSFFDGRSLIEDQIGSYNNFIGNGIQTIFRESQPFEILPESAHGPERSIKKVVIEFSDPELDIKPQVDEEDRETSAEKDARTKLQEADESFKGKSGKSGKAQVNWLANAGDDGVAGDVGKGKGKGGASASWFGDGNSHDADIFSGKGKGKGKGEKAADTWDKVRKPQEVLFADQPGAEPGGGKAKSRLFKGGKGMTGDSRKIAELGTQEYPWDLEDDMNDEDEMNMEIGKGIDALRPNATSTVEREKSTPDRSQGKRFEESDEDDDSPGFGYRMRRNKRPKLELNEEGEDKSEDLNFSPINMDTEDFDVQKLSTKDLGSGPSNTLGKQGCNKRYRLLPVEARLRGISYSSPLYAKVTMHVHYSRDSDRKDKASSSTQKHEPVHVHTKRVFLGKVPVMVRSALCHLAGSKFTERALRGCGDCWMDPGGYFIIKGSEKVIVAQEERNGQKVWLSNVKGTWVANCTPRRKGFSNFGHLRTLVKLTPPAKKPSPLNTSFWPLFTVVLPGVEALPLALVLCALGIKSDREILQMICYKDLDGRSEEEDFGTRDDAPYLDTELVQVVAPSLKDADNQLEKAAADWEQNSFQPSKRDVEVALYFVGSKSFRKPEADDRLQHGQELLKSRLLPHLDGERRKAFFLSYMVRLTCLGYLGRRQPTDRDDFKNKRLEFSGDVMSHQFRKLMSHVQNTMKKRIQKHLSKDQELASVEKYVEDKLITRGFRNSFSSGNWMGNDVMKNSGIVFDLKRANPISTLCQLRELRQYVPPTVKVGEDARHPTFSQWGRICPIDTPDGESCGLVKNMALTGIVSSAGNEALVLTCLTENNLEKPEAVPLRSLTRVTRVFVNGRWVGVINVDQTVTVVRALRDLRKKSATGNLHQVEVVYDSHQREVHVSTDSGRVLRPLLVVKKNELLLNLDRVADYIDQNIGNPHQRFDWFLRNGVVELLGVEEEEKTLIALHGEDLEKSKDQLLRRGLTFSYMEIHPSLILGLSASVIPFPHRNQSSRNLFQAHKHSKQAIGVYVTNLACRADTSGQHLFYPQVQLVKTNLVDCLQKSELFSGQNAIVAIASYTGYNQEDSIIMDQSALDRGMFRTQHYRTFKAEERPDYETFGKPTAVDENGDPKVLKSDHILDGDGLPYVGCSLGMSDVIVGKIRKPEPNKKQSADGARLIDSSTRLKAHEKGRVDQVILLQDDEGKRLAKVKLRETRVPQVGDKFSSMHGQKGIVGMVFTQEDLPFTQEGIVPDIIINPHAFPSRQTLGQICESVLGKATAKKGRQLFATPFIPAVTPESLMEVLHQSGYNGWGTETMYNGFTGKMMEAKISIGTTFYQRLTHMVEDKIKYRSRGHVHPLTRQPVADRKRHGGVKFGEMERDCLIAHGAAATLQERTFYLSDYHEIYVCRGCKQMAHVGKERVPICKFCPNEQKKKEIVKVEIPYACKLLIQELQSMGISVGLDTEIK